MGDCSQRVIILFTNEKCWTGSGANHLHTSPSSKDRFYNFSFKIHFNQGMAFFENLHTLGANSKYERLAKYIFRCFFGGRYRHTSYACFTIILHEHTHAIYRPTVNNIFWPVVYEFGWFREIYLFFLVVWQFYNIIAQLYSAVKNVTVYQPYNTPFRVTHSVVCEARKPVVFSRLLAVAFMRSRPMLIRV